MRADRLLSIVLLLQARRRMTAGTLAEELEVSERTIYRDMEALSGAGIPVTAERGQGGGWTLLEGYQTKLTGLNEAEVQSLFLSRPARLLSDLGWQQAAEAALLKLLAALPAMYRGEAEYVRQRIHVDVGPGPQAKEDLSFLPCLQQAVWEERKLEITYHLSSGPIIDCRVDPLGLVAKGSLWYLVAAIGSERHVYRVSRVRQARVLDDPCLRPQGFDLAAFWEESSARFLANLPRYEVTVRVAPAILPRLQQACRCRCGQPLGPPEADGWQQLPLQFESEAEACGYLLSFGSQLEILAPESLRERLVELAREVMGVYGEGGL